MSTGDPAPFDLMRIGEVLASHEVQYLLIGGISGMLHGMVDYRTQDVDLLIESNADNRARLAAAFTELNAIPARTTTPDRRALHGDDFVKGNTQWETDCGPIDVLVTAAGPNETIIVFGDIEPNTDYFDAGRGVTVPAASLDDVIRMKEAADRYKDHQALPELRRLRGDAYPEQPTGFDPFGEFDIEDGTD